MSAKENQFDSGNRKPEKGTDALKTVIELEDEYAVLPRIANSKGMPVLEGYPMIRRSTYDIAHEDPDESEYSKEDSYDYDMVNSVELLRESEPVYDDPDFSYEAMEEACEYELLKDRATDVIKSADDEYSVNRKRKYHGMGYDG